jgi:hypothetical protein
VKRNNWTDDQLRVLAAMFFNASFSIGDDARDECRIIADAFGRTPSSVDRQWRNMAAVVKGKTGYNIGALVRQAVTDHLSDPVTYKAYALDICRRRDWPLAGLIVRKGAVDLPTQDRPAPALLSALKDSCSSLEFKLFPSGSQGFATERDVLFGGSRTIHIQISATLIGSSQSPNVHLKASSADISRAVQELVPSVEAKVFNTGRVGSYGGGNCQVGNERFHVNIQAVEIGAQQ